MLNSKKKGSRQGELELANLLKEKGFSEARRSQQYCGINNDADVIGLDGIHIECKRVEKLNINEAMEQAKRDCGDNTPTVFHRRNNKEWLVTMRLDDWIKMYKKGDKCGK